jgi:hypothetical protein
MRDPIPSRKTRWVDCIENVEIEIRETYSGQILVPEKLLLLRFTVEPSLNRGMDEANYSGMLIVRDEAQTTIHNRSNTLTLAPQISVVIFYH